MYAMPPLTHASLCAVGNEHCKLRGAWSDLKDVSLGPQAVEKIAAHPPCANPLHLRYLVDELCRQHQQDRLNSADLFPGAHFEWQVTCTQTHTHYLFLSLSHTNFPGGQEEWQVTS